MIYFFTKGVCKLQRNAQTLSIWFDNGFNVKGIVLLKTWNMFNISMARSTWILRRAIHFVFTKSFCNNLFHLSQLHFFVKGGKKSLARLSNNRSLIKNPLSAMISWPGLTLSRKPLCIVIYLSDVLPPHTFAIKLIAPDDIILNISAKKR